MISFKVQCIFIVRRKANSNIEQQKCKGHKKRDRLLVSKVEFSYQISSEVKSLRIDPIFSYWVKFMKKLSLVHYSFTNVSWLYFKLPSNLFSIFDFFLFLKSIFYVYLII